MLTAYQVLILQQAIARQQTLAFKFVPAADPWDFWFQKWRRATVLLAELAFPVRADAG